MTQNTEIKEPVIKEQQIRGYEATDIAKVFTIMNQMTIQGTANIMYFADIINILANPKYSLKPEDATSVITE